MTDWKGHLKIGIPLNGLFMLLLGIILPITYTEPTHVFVILISIILIWLLSPLILDLDHPTSKLTSWSMSLFFGVGLAGVILQTQYLILIGLALAAIVHFMSTLSAHRGIVHSILFCILFGVITFLSYWYYISLSAGIFFGLFMTFGCYTHLIGDKLYIKVI